MRIKNFLFLLFVAAFSATLSNVGYAGVEEGVFSGDDQGKRKFLRILGEAKESVELGSYKLHQGLKLDPEIKESLTSLVKNNVPVKIILESRLSKEEMRNYKDLPLGAALEWVKETGADIISDVKNYDNVHLKLLVTKDVALIGTTNYDGHYDDFYPRDFTAIVTSPKLLEEITNVLSLVEKGESIKWPDYKSTDLQKDETRLSWGPIQHLDHFRQMIADAKKGIAIYQQDIQDLNIRKALAEALDRGVKVRILMGYYPFGKGNPNKSLEAQSELVSKGADVRLTGKKIYKDGLPLHVHGKALIVDGGTESQLMYLGSANFYPPILDPKQKNLNLGILTTSSKYIKPVLETFEEDWDFHKDQKLDIEKK